MRGGEASLHASSSSCCCFERFLSFLSAGAAPCLAALPGAAVAERADSFGAALFLGVFPSRLGGAGAARFAAAPTTPSLIFRVGLEEGGSDLWGGFAVATAAFAGGAPLAGSEARLGTGGPSWRGDAAPAIPGAQGSNTEATSPAGRSLHDCRSPLQAAATKSRTADTRPFTLCVWWCFEHLSSAWLELATRIIRTSLDLSHEIACATE
mmetsp:Transcript_13314/g.37633  ORF Transcript_13314/g.37633 Transcript_13314/m.37633 type:complete len:209 (-) Transcript_13314:706-1332(-)